MPIDKIAENVHQAKKAMAVLRSSTSVVVEKRNVKLREPVSW
jgi:hypothetical protein